MILDSNSASDAYEIANSCKFNKAGSETMYRANTNGDRRTWTTSFWMKFCGGTGSGTDTHMLYHGVYGQGTRMFTSGGTDQLYIDLCALGNERYRWITNQVFRDRSAWYHIVWRVDTTQSTLGDRMRLYVNGEQITSWQKEADDANADGANNGNKMPQNYQTLANLDHSGYDVIQFSYKEASIYSDMYMAEFHHCDGYSYGPTEFGKFNSNGIWVPIEADVSYGNNGCFLDFETSSNLGNDANGGTDFTLQNIAAADQATDTPTNNFCTMSKVLHSNSAAIIEDGGTYHTGSASWESARGTFGLNKGKWYWEVQPYYNGDNWYFGVSTWNAYPNEGTFRFGHSSNSNIQFFDPSYRTETFSWTFNNGSDFFGVALNLDDGECTFYENGSVLNSTFDIDGLETNINNGGYVHPYSLVYGPEDSCYVRFNFGGYTGMSTNGYSDANGYGDFKYSVPSGYYSLCSKNLAEYG